MVVEWEAVGQIVDAIGGVYFNVPYPMDYHDPYQDLVIEQAEGYRRLTGEDAMQVIRWRQNDNDSPHGYRKRDGGIGDSGRMELQQSFLKAVIQQLLKPANVLNIGKIATVFQQSVETDLSFQEILWFGQQAVSGGLGVENVEFTTMPYKGAGAWSRTYEQNLAYLVPSSKELLELVNTKLSPFVEEFTLGDLDIMFVNRDGSIGSTTGHVEDARAALPPEIPEEDPEITEPQVDENGNLIDPETGEVIPPEGGIVIDPEPGEIISGGADPAEGETPPEGAASSGGGSAGSSSSGSSGSASSSGSGSSSGVASQPTPAPQPVPAPQPEPEPEPDPEPTPEPEPAPEPVPEPEDSGFGGEIDWATLPSD